MLTITETNTTDGQNPTAKPAKVAQVSAGPLRLSPGDSSDAAQRVQDALGHAQRRLDNLRDLIDRFDLDDDDGPRAA